MALICLGVLEEGASFLSFDVYIRNGSSLAKHLLTIAEVADYLDVSSSDLCELIDDMVDGSLSIIRIGEQWYVPLEELPDWLLSLATRNKR